MSEQSLVPTPDAEARKWAMLCHFAAFFWLLVPMVGNVIAVLVVWQLKKDSDPFIDEQGKEALNFNITMLIAAFIGFLLTFILIGLVLLPLIGIAWLVFTILAGIKANEGVAYRYPYALRLIK